MELGKNTLKAYFDWAATAPVDKQIIRESTEIAIKFYGNPSSTHFLGTDAKKILEEARIRCGKALNVPPSTIYFTSGGTEADQIPILSLLQKPIKGTIIISAIEHPAIREQASMLTHCGWKVLEVKPDSRGIIAPEAIEKALTSDTIEICLMAVNNETGAIQPIYDVADMLVKKAKETGKRRPKLHVDCVQAAGKIPLDLSHQGIDSAALSSHKLGGPRGIGLLYLAQKIDVFVKGGGQEFGIRSGTENIAGAWALSRCLEKNYMLTDNKAHSAFQRFLEQKNITEDFITKIKDIAGCSIIPENRSEKDFSPWIVQAAFKGIPGEVLLRSLAEKGIAISTGSACSSKKMSRPVLEAMGITKEVATNGVRFSFGPTTTREEISLLVSCLQEIRNHFK